MNDNNLEQSFQPDFLLESIFGPSVAQSGSKIFVSFIYLKHGPSESGFSKVYSTYTKAIEEAANFFMSHIISNIILKKNLYPQAIDPKTGKMRCEANTIEEIREIFPTYTYNKDDPGSVFAEYQKYIRGSGKSNEQIIKDCISLLNQDYSPIYFYITTKYVDSEGDTFPQRLIDYSGDEEYEV